MITGQKTTKTLLVGTTTQVLGPNPRRVGLILSSVDTGNCWVAIGDTPASGDGIRLSGGTYTPFLILFDSPNDWITEPLQAFVSATCTFSVVELIDRQP